MPPELNRIPSAPAHELDKHQSAGTWSGVNVPVEMGTYMLRRANYFNKRIVEPGLATGPDVPGRYRGTKP